jgi:hypothetical protein
MESEHLSTEMDWSSKEICTCFHFQKWIILLNVNEKQYVDILDYLLLSYHYQYILKKQNSFKSFYMRRKKISCSILGISMISLLLKNIILMAWQIDIYQRILEIKNTTESSTNLFNTKIYLKMRTNVNDKPTTQFYDKLDIIFCRQLPLPMSQWSIRISPIHGVYIS